MIKFSVLLDGKRVGAGIVENNQIKETSEGISYFIQKSILNGILNSGKNYGYVNHNCVSYFWTIDI